MKDEWLKDMKQLSREQTEELYNIAILTITNNLRECQQQLQECKEQKDKQFFEYVKKCDELQAKQDKENKIRTVCIGAFKRESTYKPNSIPKCVVLIPNTDILQILNEGDDNE